MSKLQERVSKPQRNQVGVSKRISLLATKKGSSLMYTAACRSTVQTSTFPSPGLASMINILL